MAKKRHQSMNALFYLLPRIGTITEREERSNGKLKKVIIFIRQKSIKAHAGT